MRHGVGGIRAAAAVTAAGATLAACGGGAPAADPPESAPIRPPAVTDLRKAAREIPITGRWLSAGAGAVWLSSADAVHRLDPATGRATARIRVRQGPCAATAVGHGALWTATCRTPGLARVDPVENRVTGHVRLPVPRAHGGEAGIGVGAGSVWVVVDGDRCTECRLARVGARSMRVLARIPIASGAAAVRVGGGAVWVTNPVRDVVQRVDPRRQRVVRTTPVGDMPRFLAAGRTGAWTLNQADGTLTRVARSGGTRSVDAGVHGSGGDLASGAGWLWARGSERLLTRVDPATRQVVERYGPDSAVGAVIVGFGAVWVSAADLGTVWRLPLAQVARESPDT